MNFKEEIYESCLSIVDTARILREHRNLDMEMAVQIVIAARREEQNGGLYLEDEDS
tara:strand:- start:1 stop:168 length:168 start_codon:yes stop_codon:yes gene_type:complete